MSSTDTQQRQSNAVQVLGHPHNITGYNAGHEAATEALDVYEGVHYDVLASSMYADYFLPTVVHWNLGEDSEEHVDSFGDLESSEEMKRQAQEYHE